MKPFLNKSLFVVSLLLIGTLFFSACNKDKNNPIQSSIPLIATALRYTDSGYRSSESYQYDNQGRIIKVNDNTSSYLTYEYSDSAVIIKGYDNGNSYDSRTGQLNSKGLGTSMPSQGTNEVKTYEYDNDEYRKTMFDGNDSFMNATTYSVSEGNYATLMKRDISKTTNLSITKEAGFLESPLLSKNPVNRISLKNSLKSASIDYSIITEYQFFKDKINTIGNENMGMSFLGKQNKNPTRREFNIYWNVYTGKKSYKVINYTYEYDNKGRITKQIADDGNYTVYTYVE